MKLTLVKTEEFGILIQIPENWDKSHFITVNIPNMGIFLRPVDFVREFTELHDFINDVECFNDKWIITFNSREIDDYQFSQLVELISCCSSFSKIKLKVNWLDECDATIAAEMIVSDPEIDELDKELDKLLNK